MAIPVIIHLFNRKSAHSTDWGAMQFLAESMESRTRRIQLEDALLMATRCLIFGMFALALARPFAPPSSIIPYIIVLPALLIAICLFGVAAALWENKTARGWLLLTSIGILVLTAAAIFYENYLNLRRLSGAGKQDIALIIDASSSMTILPEGATQSNFDRALDEARDLILKSGPDSAFSLIVAGPSPDILNRIPLTDRSKLNDLIDTISASEGQMLAQEAITAAARVLEAGQHEAKQIIILTDGQSLGWQTDNDTTWEFLAEGIEELPQKPQLILRRFPAPTNFRNLAVTDIQFSRDVIGVDREVSIEVTLENTGTEAVTPNSVQLRIGDQILSDATLGQFPPGLKNTLTFKHHFREPGAQLLTAVADLDDDLSADNRFSTAVPIIDQLNVMIIDGNPAPRFFDRASAFVELALAPGMLGENGYLIEPTVVPAQQILTVQSFDNYQAVILTDVPRLPTPVAKELASYVKRGGGLLIAPGERADPEFYNTWEPAPAQLKARSSEATSPDLNTFTHRAVQKVAETGRSDFGSVILNAYWQLEATDQQAVIAANLANGSPFVISRPFGNGKVIMTNCALDTKNSNIATRDSFLPFLHELVYHIADPDALKLNLKPAPTITLTIDPTATSPEEQLVDTFSATGPRGELREADIVSTPQGTIAKITGSTIAGLYEIEIPDTAREQFEKVLTPANTLPFTVIRSPEESRSKQLTRSDLAFINRHLEVLEPKSTKEIHTILAGRSYGQELWKTLAIGALILLVLEIALANWIAKNRKTNTQI